MNQEQAAKRIRALRQEIKSHEQEVKDLIAEHFSSFKVGEGQAFGRFSVKALPNTRFDPAKAARVLDADMLRSVSVTKPDSTKAKALLDPVVYALCQAEYAPKIQVELIEEG